MTGQLDRIIELDKLYNKSHKSSALKKIAIASGKGGTGKTFFAANFAYQLSVSKKVLLIDLDFKLANIHLLFNLHPQKNLAEYFESKKLFEDVITEYNSNLHLVLGDTGFSDKSLPSVTQIEKMLEDIEKLSDKYDLVLFDLGAGISNENIFLLTQSDIKIIVAAPEPTALMDAYMVIKQLISNFAKENILVTINRVVEPEEADQAFDNLRTAVNHFLKTNIEFLVSIPESAQIRRSIIEQNLYSANQKADKVIKSFITAEHKISKINQVSNINHPSFEPTL
ncbi:MAG: AAA family ATPase [Ignavibacteriales bacterium]|nr:AAA family ATPase [Ignavibacterium album]MCZ2267993.1 AAA family ATPase [Ignavibacteriales bacterium]HMN16824.1 AAA family ATPase [Ignavibacteriaceae bacterium]HOJ06346.1 AAA family ATPase [Ignavibacteriaceae bacterium]